MIVFCQEVYSGIQPTPRLICWFNGHHAPCLFPPTCLSEAGDFWKQDAVVTVCMFCEVFVPNPTSERQRLLGNFTTNTHHLFAHPGVDVLPIAMIRPHVYARDCITIVWPRCVYVEHVCSGFFFTDDRHRPIVLVLGPAGRSRAVFDFAHRRLSSFEQLLNHTFRLIPMIYYYFPFLRYSSFEGFEETLRQSWSFFGGSTESAIQNSVVSME